MGRPSITGFDESGVMGNREVEDLVGSLPIAHTSNPPLQAISYIHQVKLRNPRDRRPQPEQVLGECEIDEDNGTANISIFLQKDRGNDDEYDFLHSIYHEIAHVVFWNLKNHQQQKWYALYGRTPVYWNMAGMNPVEHFCDTYAHYLLVPEVVEKRFVQEYDYLKKEVFIG